MSNPVSQFRNNLFASRGCDIQSALDYAEMMINTLSAVDQVSVRDLVIKIVDVSIDNITDGIFANQFVRVDSLIDQGNDGQLLGARALGLGHCTVDGV